MESDVVGPHLETHCARPSTSEGTTTLPEDLLTEQSIRIQLLYILGVRLWVLNFVMDGGVAPNSDRGLDCAAGAG